MERILAEKKSDLRRLCKLLKIERLFAFGSVVTGNFRDDSDLDFLISFAKDLSPEEYADNFLSLHYKLREIFGREIDVITERSLSNPYFIESINVSKELIYEA